MKFKQNGGILIKGLKGIGDHLGVDYRIIKSWYEHLDFPMLVHPSAKLGGKQVSWVTSDVLIQAWLMQPAVVNEIQWYLQRATTMTERGRQRLRARTSRG